MNRLLRTLPVVAALLAMPWAAFAATPIDLSRAATADVHVRIENIAGSVEVRPGESNRVQVTGSLGRGAKPLSLAGSDSRITIAVEPEGSRWGGSNMDETDLIVQVPAGARLEVNTVSARIHVTGINGSHVDLESVSGAIVFGGDAQRVRLKTVSGSIEGRGAGRDWNVGTVSGSIRLPAANGEVQVESVSGAIDLDFGRAERLRAETVSGRINARGELLAGGSVAMQSVSGAIELALAGNLDARINAKTFSGAIRSDFGTAERSGIGGGRQLETRVGEGASDIRLESFSGRIVLRGE